MIALVACVRPTSYLSIALKALVRSRLVTVCSMTTPYHSYGAVAPQPSQGPAPVTQPTYVGDVPPEDVDEQSAPGRAPSAPPAPNLSDLGQIGGYERVNYTNSGWEEILHYGNHYNS